MAEKVNRIPDFDEIVFEKRNKEYGAYQLRKKYNKNVLTAMLSGVVIVSSVVVIPYINARAFENSQKQIEREVLIKLDNLDTPNETVVAPPPPPPPAETVQQAKYVPPVVVDSVKAGDEVQMMTAEEAIVEIKNEEVVAIVEEVKEEIKEEEPEPEPFVTVEEMPMYPGGDAELLKYLREHAVYPEIARENNIQGRVIIKFCVTPTGEVNKISVLKTVDPELDAEAIRVVGTLPRFKPGRQGGKPVPVWYQAFINFRLQ